MKLYKLTTPEWETKNHTKWGPGVEHVAPGKGELCTSAYLHAYVDKYLAALVYRVHMNLYNPVMWLADGDVEKSHGLKVGCTRLKTIEITDMPQPTMEQYVTFGILCGKEVYTNAGWNQWADRWLDGTDRSATAADYADHVAHINAAGIDFVALARKAMGVS